MVDIRTNDWGLKVECAALYVLPVGQVQMVVPSSLGVLQVEAIYPIRKSLVASLRNTKQADQAGTNMREDWMSLLNLVTKLVTAFGGKVD